MKCKLDENLGDVGRDALTAAGHDVATVAALSRDACVSMSGAASLRAL
jgi:hypothetical protein